MPHPGLVRRGEPTAPGEGAVIRYYGNQAWGAAGSTDAVNPDAYVDCWIHDPLIEAAAWHGVYWSTQHSLQAVGTGAIVGRDDWGLKVFGCQFYDPEYQYWATRHFEAWRSARIGFGAR